MESAIQGRLAPSIVIRLLWWFGIYFAAQIPFIIGHDRPAWVVMFPTLLGFLTAPIWHLFPDRPFITIVGFLCFVAFPYGVYGLHLYATLKTRSHARFDLLLVVLVLLVLLTQFGTRMLGPITG
jgi:hypothetical protein